MEARLRSPSQLAKDVKAIVALISAAPSRPAMTAKERPVNDQGTSTRKPRN